MDIKLVAGGYKYPAKMYKQGQRIFLEFSYNKSLLAEIKSLEGAKYHGYDPNPKKIWSIADTEHNKFQLEYLQGGNPYARYDAQLDDVIKQIPLTRFHTIKQKEIPLFKHQLEGIAHIYRRQYSIVAGEMGTSKTLMNIVAAEMAASKVGSFDGWYVAPRSVLHTIRREFLIWDFKFKNQTKLMTYEEFTKRMKSWESGRKPPNFLTFDEASKLKNATAQRTQAAQALSNAIRAEWGDNGFICLMSGTPAPKSPADWYSLAEIACPGFLKEGDIFKFRNRLAIIIQKQDVTGGSYPQLVSWRDDPNKCDICGQYRDHENHKQVYDITGSDTHEFKQSKNEVALLSKRLKGLAVTYMKRNCLDLPEKTYRLIEVKPTPSVLRTAKMILKTSATVIEGLTKWRELSDGFQYTEEETGSIECTLCHGEKQIEQPREVPDTCPNCKDQERIVGEFGQVVNICPNHTPQIVHVFDKCPTCGGVGRVKRYKREIKEIPCPKDQVIIDLLDEFEDVGRVVLYAGFTGSIDRCVRLCQQSGWHVIRIDQGRDQVFNDKGNPLPVKDYLSMFQDQKEQYPRVAYIAHPGSGGMGATLTASPVAIYFSNDFNGEYRAQSEDRIHRPGMDYNLGATIIDIIHLPSDAKVIENLKKKRNLQLMTLGEFDSRIR